MLWKSYKPEMSVGAVTMFRRGNKGVFGVHVFKIHSRWGSDLDKPLMVQDCRKLKIHWSPVDYFLLV